MLSPDDVNKVLTLVDLREGDNMAQLDKVGCTCEYFGRKAFPLVSEWENPDKARSPSTFQGARRRLALP